MSTPYSRPTTSRKRKRRMSFAEIKDGFTTRPVSNLLWTEESLSCYGPGGCHPVCLGDTFKDGRYKVAHKLGGGVYSTVWLAEDTTTKSWVALQIFEADESRAARHELTMLEALHADANTSGLIPVVLDDFVHDGPNGLHRCTIMQAFGPSLKTAIEGYGNERMDSENLLRLARQVLEATAAFHEAGFAHGDLDAINIVFTTRNMAKLPNKAFIKTLGKQETAKLLRTDGSPLDESLPKQLVGSAEWDNWIDVDEEDIRLISVGDSFRVGERIPSSEADRDSICAPEVLLKETFDYRVDLWRAGYIMYALLTVSTPFMHMGDDTDLVTQMINFIGELPAEWEPRWKEMREASSDPIDTSRDADSTLETWFEEHVMEPELAPLLPVMRGLMQLRPQDRISARDALRLLDRGINGDASSSGGAEA